VTAAGNISVHYIASYLAPCSENSMFRTEGSLVQQSVPHVKPKLLF